MENFATKSDRYVSIPRRLEALLEAKATGAPLSPLALTRDPSDDRKLSGSGANLQRDERGCLKIEVIDNIWTITVKAAWELIACFTELLVLIPV